MLKWFIRLIFISIFIFATYYIIFIKTEKFSSSSTIIIKDLAQKQSVSMLGSMLLGDNTSSIQDSKLLELYITSFSMFNILDQKYNLREYYSSNRIDFIQRLSQDTLFSFNKAIGENFIKSYQKDTKVIYDEVSGTLNISFMHSDATTAQKIVEDIVMHSTEALNRFEKENAKVALDSLITQEKDNKKLFIDSIKKLISYQNMHGTIDPNIDVQSKSNILASLESDLIKKEVEYKSKLGYLNKNTAQMRLIRDTIHQMKLSIKDIKKKIAGKSGKNNLNKNVSNFELLKSEVDFNKERYKQTLIKLDETKISVQQNVKNLIIITKPGLAEIYSEPNKIKEIITLFIVLFFMYGISSLMLNILREHKD